MTKFAVIIPAAGRGERFGGSEKKTFAKLDGRPVFLRSVELFIHRDDVCQTILAVAPEDVGTMKSQFGANLGFMGVQLVEGGTTRAATVKKALAAVSPEAEYVAVHDAARPCVAPELIDAVFSEATKSGAAILACPLTGTIKRVASSKIIEETVSRDGLHEAQTPQVFRKELLTKAYAAVGEQDNSITDEAQAVEQSGHPVAMVESDATNLKITTKADIALANAILKARPSRPVPKLGAFEEAKW